MSFLQILELVLQLTVQITGMKGNFNNPQVLGPVTASEEGNVGTWTLNWTPQPPKQ